MQIDTMRALFTYITALVVIVGGGLFLFATFDRPPAESNQLVTGAVISVVTLAVNFIFTKETATATARQTERAVIAGQNAGSNSNAGNNE